MYLNNDEKNLFEIVSFSFRWNDFSIENQLDKKISKNIEDANINKKKKKERKMDFDHSNQFNKKHTKKKNEKNWIKVSTNVTVI